MYIYIACTCIYRDSFSSQKHVIYGDSTHPALHSPIFRVFISVLLDSSPPPPTHRVRAKRQGFALTQSPPRNHFPPRTFLTPRDFNVKPLERVRESFSRRETQPRDYYSSPAGPTLVSRTARDSTPPSDYPNFRGKCPRVYFSRAVGEIDFRARGPRQKGRAFPISPPPPPPSADTRCRGARSRLPRTRLSREFPANYLCPPRARTLSGPFHPRPFDFKCRGLYVTAINCYLD